MSSFSQEREKKKEIFREIENFIIINQYTDIFNFFINLFRKIISFCLNRKKSVFVFKEKKVRKKLEKMKKLNKMKKLEKMKKMKKNPKIQKKSKKLQNCKKLQFFKILIKIPKMSFPKEESITKPIIYGSMSFWLGKKAEEKASHKWVCYVRGVNNEDLSYFIKKVVFTLHPSFKIPIRSRYFEIFLKKSINSHKKLLAPLLLSCMRWAGVSSKSR